MRVLDDPDRLFASSAFVRLEVLPKAVYHKCTDEARFYEAFFSEVSRWANTDEDLIENAHEEATRSGLSAVDSLHVAAAKAVGADELLTTEKESKPLHRATSVAVKSIRPASDS